MIFDLQMFIIVAMMVFAGGAGLYLALQVAQCFMRRQLSVKTLFIGLKAKLFMTFCLGGGFFTFYLGGVYFVSHWLNREMRQYLFELAHRHPLYFVYAGLAFFVSISISILVVRKVIKRFYNSLFLF